MKSNLTWRWLVDGRRFDDIVVEKTHSANLMRLDHTLYRISYVKHLVWIFFWNIDNHFALTGSYIQSVVGMHSWNENMISNLFCTWTTFFLLCQNLITKGQLISKGLFGILNSSKKWTKEFDLTSTMIPPVDLFSFVFGRIWRHQKDISKLTDL